MTLTPCTVTGCTNVCEGLQCGRDDCARNHRGEAGVDTGGRSGNTPPVGHPATLTLPWEVLCSVNERTNPVGGRQYLTERYRTALRGAESKVRGQWGRPIIAGPVALTFDFYPPDKRRRDASNWIKLPEDAMKGTVYHDDSQVRTFTVTEHGADRDDGRVEITVREV